MPSTSSGIGIRCELVKKKCSKCNKLPNADQSLSSTSSDSESAESRTPTSSKDTVRCLQCKKSGMLKSNEEKEDPCKPCRTNVRKGRPRYSSHLDQAGNSTAPSCSRTSTSVRGRPLKRKNREIYKGKSVKTKASTTYSTSSDSDDAVADSSKIQSHHRKGRPGEYRSAERSKTSTFTPQSHTVNNCDTGLGSVPSSHESQSCEHSTSRQEIPSLQQLPEPTFTRQLEAITGRLDHLMFLQRNALDPSQRGRNGNPQDNSPLRNAGQLILKIMLLLIICAPVFMITRKHHFGD